MIWSGYRAAIILAGSHQDDMARLMKEMLVIEAVLRCKGIEPYCDSSLEMLQERLMDDGLGFEDMDLMMVHASMGDAPEIYGDIAPKVGIFVHMPSISDGDYDTDIPRQEKIMGGRPYGRFSDCYMFLKKREGLAKDLDEAVDYFMEALQEKRGDGSGSFQSSGQPGP